MLRILLRFLIFAALTSITQIGGLAYLLALAIGSASGLRSRPLGLCLFLACYAAATFMATVVAPMFGRVPLSCFADAGDKLAVRSPLFCALNRNYVTPRMRDLANALAADIDAEFPGTTTLALDANFPFFDGFPMFPHLSHVDGRKLDIAFYYADAGGQFLDGATRSPIGYFAFEQPGVGAELPCEGRDDWFTLRWDMDLLQPLFPDYRLEPLRTAAAAEWLTTEGVAKFGVEKIFLEPHLKQSLGIASDKVRFQGCRAARHDDHIHIQITP